MSNLADHKFRHKFQNWEYPICSCGQEFETSINFLLQCVYDHSKIVNKIDLATLKQNDQVITKVLLWGNEKLEGG